MMKINRLILIILCVLILLSGCEISQDNQTDEIDDVDDVEENNKKQIKNETRELPDYIERAFIDSSNTIISAVFWRESGYNLYFIRLFPDGVLNTIIPYTIEILLDDYDQYIVKPDFALTNIEESRDVEFTQEQFQEMTDLIDKISDDDLIERSGGNSHTRPYFDIIYEGKVYPFDLWHIYNFPEEDTELSFYYNDIIYPHMKKLIKLLIEYAEIPDKELDWLFR